MIILLRAIFEIFLKILAGMAVPFALAVLGAAAISALLWLAVFPWKGRNIASLLRIWLGVGIVCAFFYSLLIYAAPALKGSLLLFLVSLLTGLLFRFLGRFYAPTNKDFRWWSFSVGWTYYWLAACLGLRYDVGGLLIITLPALVVAIVFLFYVAGFLLPYPELDFHRGERPASGLVSTYIEEIKDFLDLMRRPDNEQARKQWFQQRRDALRCLLTYAFGTNYPYYVVIDEKITERTEDSRTWLPWKDKLIKRLGGDLFGDFLAGPGIILTGCDQAVVLSTGLSFKGAKGPGVIFTGMSEGPAQVIDLRVQLRAFPVEAWTKDGIAIRVFTFTPFQIGTGQNKPELGKGFPYRASDVFKAIHAQMVEHEDLSQVPENVKRYEWYDLPKVIGERAVRDIISRYTFDELYAPSEEGGQHPRAEIGAALAEAMTEALPEFGLQRIGSGISNLEPMDSRALEQRVEAWRADWARKIMLQQAEGQSKRLRTIEEARARAQVDVILAVGEQIEKLRTGEGPISMNAVARHFIEIVEELAGKPALRRFIPGDTDSVIQRARSAIGKPTDTGG
jgi:hypothetical protein